MPRGRRGRRAGTRRRRGETTTGPARNTSNSATRPRDGVGCRGAAFPCLSLRRCRHQRVAATQPQASQTGRRRAATPPPEPRGRCPASPQRRHPASGTAERRNSSRSPVERVDGRLRYARDSTRTGPRDQAGVRGPVRGRTWRTGSASGGRLPTPTHTDGDRTTTTCQPPWGGFTDVGDTCARTGLDVVGSGHTHPILYVPDFAPELVESRADCGRLTVYDCPRRRHGSGDRAPRRQWR